MGTETSNKDQVIIDLHFSPVKLNNPQMGTETLFQAIP